MVALFTTVNCIWTQVLRPVWSPSFSNSGDVTFQVVSPSILVQDNLQRVQSCLFTCNCDVAWKRQAANLRERERPCPASKWNRKYNRELTRWRDTDFAYPKTQLDPRWKCNCTWWQCSQCPATFKPKTTNDFRKHWNWCRSSNIGNNVLCNGLFE